MDAPVGGVSSGQGIIAWVNEALPGKEGRMTPSTVSWTGLSLFPPEQGRAWRVLRMDSPLWSCSIDCVLCFFGRPCTCNVAGSLGTCDPHRGSCPCKENVEGSLCDRWGTIYKELPEVIVGSLGRHPSCVVRGKAGQGPQGLGQACHPRFFLKPQGPSTQEDSQRLHGHCQNSDPMPLKVS